jgi:hypothetical protein
MKCGCDRLWGVFRGLPQDVHRASDAPPTAVENVRVDHRRAYIAMPQQFLDRPEVVTVLEEVSGKRVTEGVAGDMLFHICRRRRLFHRALKDGFVEVVPVSVPCFRIRILSMRRENPLPSPGTVRVNVLFSKRFRKFNVSSSLLQIFFMLNANIIDVQF